MGIKRKFRCPRRLMKNNVSTLCCHIIVLKICFIVVLGKYLRSLKIVPKPQRVILSLKFMASER